MIDKFPQSLHLTKSPYPSAFKRRGSAVTVFFIFLPFIFFDWVFSFFFAVPITKDRFCLSPAEDLQVILFFRGAYCVYTNKGEILGFGTEN